MKLFDYTRFALKNLWRQKARTFLTIFAIVIGAVSVITMLSLVRGASNIFMEQFRQSGALNQVTVVSNTDASGEDAFRGYGGGDSSTGVKLTDDTVEKVRKVAHVTDVTPIMNGLPFRTFVLKDDPTAKKYSMNDSQAYIPGPTFDHQLLAGRQLQKTEHNAIILGATWPEKFGYKDNAAALVGKKLVFTTEGWYSGEGAVITPPPTPDYEHPENNKQMGPQSPEEQKGAEIEATIVGVLSPGDDDRTSYVTIDWARAMSQNRHYEQDMKAMEEFNTKMDAYNRSGRRGAAPTYPPYQLKVDDMVATNGYQTIFAHVDDPANVEQAASDIKKLGVGAATAKTMIDQIMQTFKILSYVLGAIGAVSLLVAAIGVINTMVMATLERTREIGVMRACGASKGAVAGLFTTEAASLGFWGGAAGVAIALGLMKIGNILAQQQLAKQHITVGTIITMPVWLAVAVIGATTLIGMLAGLGPAIRAARLNPVDALRYE